MKFLREKTQSKLMLIALLFGSGSLMAQHLNTSSHHESTTSNVNYEAWKEAKYRSKGTNQIIKSKTYQGRVICYIYLAESLKSELDAEVYRAKLSQHPDLISVEIDHQLNQAKIVVKEEDEEQVLKSVFDIE